MEPEGIVDVLHHLCDALVPEGRIVDLQAIRPSGGVQVDGQPIGRIDDSAFFARADLAVAGLDALTESGRLVAERQIVFDTLVHFDAGAELIAAVANSSERRLPDDLAARLAEAGPCVVRETSMVRVLRQAGNRRPYSSTSEGTVSGRISSP